jgi:hypothetical protein
MIKRLAFLAALLCALPASAQDAEPRPAPTAEQIATAKSEADRIIAAGDATDVFENATTSALIVVRHRPSDLLCHFIGDQDRDRLVVIPSSPGTGELRGNDIACSSYIGDIELTLYFTLYADGHSAQENTQRAVDAIINRYPDLKPHPGDLTIISGPDGDPNWAAFDVTADGRDLMTFVAVTKIGDWMIKARATGPVQDANHVSTLATALMMRAQRK